MAIVTDAQVLRADTGEEIAADCQGNNAAVSCPNCSHPVLLIARTHQRGSRQDRPGVCRVCSAAVWIVSPVDAGLEVDAVRIDFELGTR